MTRYILMVTFLHDHAKSIILASGAIGIWVAQAATDAMDAAKEIGGWSTASVLVLVCIALAAYSIYRERTEREDRKERDKAFLDALERNTEGYEKMCDLIEDVKTEVMEQKKYHETVIKEIIEKGLNAPPTLARTRTTARN